MYNFIIKNIELCTGIFLGLMIALFICIIIKFIFWNHSYTTCDVVKEDKDFFVIQCRHCDFCITQQVSGANRAHYCPGCGRRIEKIYEPLKDLTEV